MDAKNKENVTRLLCKPENLEAALAIGDSLSDVINHLVNKVFMPELTAVCEALCAVQE